MKADKSDAIKRLTGAKKVVIKRGVPQILDDGISMPSDTDINNMIATIDNEISIQGTKENLSLWLKQILDDTAQSFKYDNMLSVRTYTGYPNIYQKECVEMAMWASNTWYVLESIEKQVLNGDISINNKTELKEQLPKFVPGS